MVFTDPPLVAPTVDDPILVEINARMVPIVLRALDRYKYAQFWESQTDFENGLQQINKLQEALLTGTTEIVNAIDRLYRLMDTALNGRVYTAQIDIDTGEILGVEPAISPAPEASPEANTLALRAMVQRLWALQENTVTGRVFLADTGIFPSPALSSNVDWRQALANLQGETGAGWFGIGGRPATIADLLQAGRVNNAEDRQAITDAIDAVAQSDGSLGSLAPILSSLLSTAGAAATDGGLGMLQIASTLANLAGQAALSNSLVRIAEELILQNNGLLGTTAGPLQPPLERVNILNRMIAALDGGNGATGTAQYNILRALYNDPLPNTPEMGIANLLLWIAGPAAADGNNNTLLDMLSTIGSRLIDSEQNIRVADWTALTAAATGQIASVIGPQLQNVSMHETIDAIRQMLAERLADEEAGITQPGSLSAQQIHLLECICEALSATTPPELPGDNEPPPDSCIGGGYSALVRCTGWENKGTKSVGGVDFDMLMPIFGYADVLPLVERPTRVESGNRYYQLAADGEVTVCLSWNFAGGTLPVDFCRDVGTGTSIADSTSHGCTSVSSLEAGARAEEFTRSEVSTQRWVWLFRFPTGYTPPNNVWFAARSL